MERAVPIALALALLAACSPPAEVPPPAVVGRWDVTMQPAGGRPYASWFEVVREGDSLSGRWQPGGGHATPIVRIAATADSFSFERPPESDLAAPGIRFSGQVANEQVTGTMTELDGTVTPFTAVRTPALVRTAPPVWGEPIDLLAKGIDGWHLQDPEAKQGWRVVDGILENTEPGGNLVSNGTWMDFKLELEVNVPPGGNSGIYLRGRHEVQVLDSYGKPAGSREMGGIYGQVTPTENPAKPAGEWQTFEITLVGRRVTVSLNGVHMIHDQEIPGVTGGAMDANSGEPGPIMLQGDHGPIRFRNVRITPAM
ncbi:MAG: DUF1080 domain-containing protein [Gemmatimonadales bacterium]|nr:DUF1080 domain-containing protein [Gemmatimonadales bacterium]